MVHYFIPFAIDKKLFHAFDYYMSLVPDHDAWICFVDGDTAFLRPDWGRVIEEYVKKYPDTGLFTCYASRCHYEYQRPAGADQQRDSILYHKEIVDLVAEGKYDATIIPARIAGHLMVIKKSTWIKIRETVAITARAKNVLGVDTKISNAILASGMKIRLMKELYIFHYLRMKEGLDYKDHLI